MGFGKEIACFDQVFLLSCTIDQEKIHQKKEYCCSPNYEEELVSKLHDKNRIFKNTNYNY